MDGGYFALDFLTSKDNYYLNRDLRIVYEECPELDLADLALFKIEEVSFEDQAPRREALENVLSTLKIDGINFIYLILGNSNGVEFYYGVSRNYNTTSNADLNIWELGSKLLEPSIKGNFRGSKTREVDPEAKRNIIGRLRQMTQYSVLEGVPGVTNEDEKFQGVDRLADVMMGDNFGFMIVATPATYEEIRDIELNLCEVFSKLAPLSKTSKQTGTSTNEGYADGDSKGTSSSTAWNSSLAINDGTSRATTFSYTFGYDVNTTSGTNTSSNGSSSSSGTSKSGTTGRNDGYGKNVCTTDNDGKSATRGKTETTGENSGENHQHSHGTGTSEATTYDLVNKKAQIWLKYLDDVIMPRLDYGLGKGIYITTSFLFSNSVATIKKLENTAISLYSGEEGNKVPLRAVSLGKDKRRISYVTNFQLPAGTLKRQVLKDNEAVLRSALSQHIRENKFAMGNWITTKELALISGLPQKEVVGLALKEDVEFGLNYSAQIEENNRLYLGDLVQSGNVLPDKQVYLDKADLDKHIFVAGATGSGKTTTCHNILCNSGLPFLVIEPAKTEYRVLIDKYPDLMVFTLGNENVGTPFRLNPFEFFPHESITSRADMIKASIEAAFDMEAAIPQIIESSIYACYEDYGWDIATNKNSKFAYPFADGVFAFPTLEDLMRKVSQVVKEQGFDTRLQNDYIGSIRARLLGLLAGSKGLMLNTPRSINFRDLLERRVVLELEEIRDGDEKSLIMGFVLMNLMQAIRGKYIDDTPHRHVTLVEEAHRLLSKFLPGDSPNKKRGVETFADMLAEIRKYGECLVIVDQIPNKMTPEVLKNTNTKIVHKLFATDDKDAIGNTIVLDDDQKAFLSNLDTGRAVVFSQGYSKAIQVQVKQIAGIDDSKRIKEADLQPVVYAYYCNNYKKGLISNIQYLENRPLIRDLPYYLKLSYDRMLSNAIAFYCGQGHSFPSREVTEALKALIDDPRTASCLQKIHTESHCTEQSELELEQYVKNYGPRFGLELLAYITTEVFYVSKYAKGRDNLKHKLPNEQGLWCVYLAECAHDEARRKSCGRTIRDLL